MIKEQTLTRLVVMLLTSFITYGCSNKATVNGIVGSPVDSGQKTIVAEECKKEGQIGCITTSEFVPTKKSGLAAKVLVGSSVAGVEGTLTVPSNCTADGVIGCVTTEIYKSADLTDLISVNLKKNIYIAGVTGSLITETHADCSSDGEKGCVAVSNYPAAKVANITNWDLRSGKTIGGVSGSLKTNCRNTINKSYFNWDGALAGLVNTPSAVDSSNYDFWDTIDEHYGWSNTQVSGWAADTYCDSSTWTDVTTTDGGLSFTTCTSGTCIYQDKISNLKVTGILKLGDHNTSDTTAPASLSWSDAINACNNSTYGGYSAGSWRLPTQKEQMALYEHGLVAVAGDNFMTLSNMQDWFWSSSTLSSFTSFAWELYPSHGYAYGAAKTDTCFVMCVAL